MGDAPWFALAIDYWRNPKVALSGFLAASLNIAALGYCTEQLTDGFVPTGVVRMLAAPMHGWVWVGEDGESVTPRDVAASRWEQLAESLVESGLWEPVSGGWTIVNYLKHQPSRAEVEKKKEQAREAGRLGGLKRGANRSANQTASAPPSATSSGSLPPAPAPAPTPNTSTAQSKTLVRSGDFVAWYDAYPRKASPGLAAKAYDKALRRTDAATLLAGALRYRLDPNREDSFTKLPATWLNQDCWDDEPLPSRSTGVNRAEERDRRNLALVQHFAPTYEQGVIGA